MNETFIQKGLNYATYRAQIQSLLTKNQTTGTVQSPELVAFTQLNEQRMHRNEKQFHLNDHLSNILKTLTTNEIWIVFVEAWCGDCAQNIPILQKIAEHSKQKISLRYFIKSENMDTFRNYLSNGSEAIPKLIRFDASTLKELGTWGARPFPAQQIAENWKKNKATIPKEAFEKELHLWYARDKGQTLQNEISNLLKVT